MAVRQGRNFGDDVHGLAVTLDLKRQPGAGRLPLNDADEIGGLIKGDAGRLQDVVAVTNVRGLGNTAIHDLQNPHLASAVSIITPRRGPDGPLATC